MTTFLVRLDPGDGEGPRLAVKDIIDVAGLPTTSACRPVAERAIPAFEDAHCVARARAAGARLVGKTNLHELAFGGTGINPYTGTPTNPLDPERIPGGSSSGSAVAVATGEADVALGTDTGGSIRTPAACCGVVGLKTTAGRIPTDGVAPLAPTLDTVGPLAATVAGVVTGMALLEPGFAVECAPATTIGRFRLTGTTAAVDAAIDAALAAAGCAVVAADLASWDLADAAGSTVAFAEASRVHARLLADDGDSLGDEVRGRLINGGEITDEDYERALALADPWRHELDLALARTPVLATSAILDEPPLLTDPDLLDTRRPNVAINLAGHPAIVVPIPAALVPGTRLPTAVQLIAAHGREDLLCATAQLLETAVASSGA